MAKVLSSKHTQKRKTTTSTLATTISPLNMPLGNGSGLITPSREKHKGPSPLDNDLDFDVDFLLDMVAIMQEGATRKAHMMVIGQTKCSKGRGVTHTRKVKLPKLHEQFRNNKAFTIMASKIGEVVEIKLVESYVKRPVRPMITVEIQDISKFAAAFAFLQWRNVQLQKKQSCKKSCTQIYLISAGNVINLVTLLMLALPPKHQSWMGALM